MDKFDFAAVRFGLLITMTTLLMGVYLGVHFGKNEDDIKGYLKEKATASAAFKGDEKLIKKAVKNGWKYLKRSHEHFQGLGAISLGLILILSASWLKPKLKSLVSIGVGLGSFIYPLFWYLVAYKVAGMEKHAAKESLALVAQAGAGLYLVSFLAVFATVFCYAIWKDSLPSFLAPLKETD